MFCVSVGDERGGKRKQGVPVVGFARSPCSEYNVKTGQRWGTEPSGIWEKSTPGRGNSRCKGPKVGVCLVCCCGHSSPLNVTLSMLASAKLNIWNEGQCISHLEIYHTIQQTILWSYSLSKTTFCLFIEFIYLFLEKGEGKEKEREKNIDVWEKHPLVASVPPAGDLAHNPGMCPDWESNQQPFGSQANTQSTEPHQPGHKITFYLNQWI